MTRPPQPGPPHPQVTIHAIGQEREPLAVLDRFSGSPDAFLEIGRRSHFQAAGAFYPGFRAPARPDLVDRRRDLVARVLEEVFGLRQPVVLEMLAYALVTTPPGDLAPLQAIPHYDAASEAVVAGMFYMMGPETGGTAFYRHRLTGYETITAAREQACRAAMAEDGRAFGSPPRAYHYGDTPRYKMIHEVEARPDRLVLYRAKLLHSGVIPDPSLLSPDPAEGRMTMNMFFRGG